ncbi:ribbon-helix-helix domain-containing protein [Sporanaerobium hydrogeniformans]|nr:ribbon-helix-helix domain-containing protein [Sporanaerobium hydrogeniformans]
MRLKESTAGQLKDLSEQLGLPIASIIRQGIHIALHDLSEESK